MSRDVIGDFLTVIRNALMIYRRSVTVPSSKLKVAISQLLMDEGFIKDFKQFEDESGKKFLTLSLKYVNGVSAINEITRISTPGRRRYERANKLTSVIGGLGVSVLSTSSGIMTDHQARKLGIGGEVLCHIW